MTVATSVQGFRLSPQQRRAWLLAGAGAPPAFLALALRGEVDPPRLRRALGRVVARHDALRTRFVRRPGIRVPIQVIEERAEPGWEEADLRSLGEAPRAAELARLEAEALAAADPGGLPVVRAWLLHLDEAHHELWLTLPALGADTATLDLLAGDLAAAYAAAAGGEDDEEPVQYVQYSEWQNDLFEDEDEDEDDPEARTFWRRQWHGLARGAELGPELPAAGGAAAEAEAGAAASAAAVPVPLPDGVVEALDRRVAEHGGDRQAWLLAAWGVLLGRLQGSGPGSGGEPFPVAALFDGRLHEELKETYGPFAKRLPIRVPAVAGQPFVAAVDELARTLADATGYQDYFQWEGLDGEEGPHRFTAGFDLLPLPRDRTVAGVEIGVARRRAGADEPALTLAGVDGGPGGPLALELRHDPGRVDSGAAERLAARYAQLLAGATGDPATPVNRLDLLPAGERRRVVYELNDTATDLDPEIFPRRFRRAVEADPEAAALVDPDGALTYGELGERSARLAAWLAGRGIGPGAVVAVHLERSAPLVVALLGVLESGAAYLPVDPETPPERLEYMLRDSAAALRLVDREAEPVAGVEAVTAAAAEAAASGLDGAAAEAAPERSAGPGDLAYVLYTSGSTGHPKGVAVEHRQLAHYCAAACRRLELPADAAYALVSTPAADLGHTSLFPALALGATLQVLDGELAADPDALAAWFEEHPADCMKITPSHMAALLRAREPARLMPRRRLVLGGEAASPAAVAAMAELAPECRIFNHYGPTETTVGAAAVELVAAELTGDRLPLGRPLANVRLYVVDRHGEPVPLGVPGELWIGGAGVSRGYHSRPALTADRFLPDPFSEASGARLYRTGDLVRRRADGELEFLGRVDHQVKLRGFRVELEEVERVLARQDGVAEAAVVLREDAPGDPRLTAYLVAAGAGDEDAAPSLDPRVLRRDLLRELPEYMIPSTFVARDSLPLTANGKVDRRALAAEPAPADDALRAAREMVEPRTPVEELVAGIWAEVLRRPRVGVAESFFDLGGHSLLATQVVARLREVFQVEVPLRVLFENPTVTTLARRVEAARTEAAGGDGEGLVAPPLKPAPRDRPLPLSFAQSRLWFLHSLEPASSFYNSPGALRLTGELDVAALRRTLSEVVRRHEVLRTAFATVGGEPVQDVRPAAPLQVPLVDLAGLGKEGREAEARRIALAEARRPFDLASAPQLRARLLCLGAAEHTALFTLHHIVSDAWSVGILVREVTELYAAHLAGEASPLEELEVQYADFAAWQRSWLSGEVLQRQLDFWAGALSGAPPLLELPTDLARPRAQTFRGAHLGFALGEALSAALKEFAGRRGATLFMVVLAAFQALLARMADQGDVVVGTPVAGRTHRELEPLIGFFANTLALRARVDAGTGFAGLLSQVRETALQAYAHQDLPFERLVDELAPERDLAHAPIFQVMFTLQNARREVLEMPGLEVAGAGVESGAAKFDLTLAAVDAGERVAGSLEYNLDLFDEATARRLLEGLERLLAAAVEEPERPLLELPLLSDEERRELLEAASPDTPAPSGLDLAAELWRSSQASSAPALAAIPGLDGGDGETWSHAELARRAGALARRLGELGVGPESRVGLVAERRPETLAAMLAVLWAGGAWVPVDPAWPGERRAAVLEAALAGPGEPVLLLPPGPAAGDATVELPAGAGGHVLELTPEVFAGDPSEPVQVPGSAAAYVVFTSGTSGRPKGVVARRDALALRVAAMVERYGLEGDDRVFQYVSLAFDAAVESVLPALLAGGSVILHPDPAAIEPAELLRAAATAGATTLHMNASAWLAVASALERDEAEVPASLRRVVVGGESFPVAALSRWLAAAPLPFWNAYGPTEATVTALAQEVAPGDALAARLPRLARVPVGRPLGGTRAYVVDRRGGLSPVAAPGELWLGGGGLARGYLGRPAETADRFRPDPFAGESVGPGARVYRSGDLARHLPGGGFEFLGRRDGQMKVRGVRLEPAEVEAALTGHPAVAEAAAVLHGSGAEGRLVAYWVAAPEAAPVAPSELRAAAAAVLPRAAVPSLILRLDELPRSATGKVDRAALALRALPSREGGGAPEGPVEELVANVWRELLEVDAVTRGDGFFALGGHSLLATRLVSRLREVLGVAVPLKLVFEAPVLADLAARVEAEMRRGQGVEAPPLEAAGRDGELPLSFAQQRLWFLDRLEPDSALYNMPSSWRLRGAVDLDALDRAMGEVVRRHEMLRTVFASREGRPVQVVRDAAPVRMPRIDLSALAPEQRPAQARRLAAREASLPFDLAHGPLLRPRVVRLAEDDHALLLVLHHIIADGWSMAVLRDELAALYARFAAGLPSDLPELPLQYADFAAWQRGWLRGGVLEEQLRWWSDLLGGEPEPLDLPTDRPRPPVQSYHGGRRPVAVPAAVTRRLDKLARDSGSTHFMLVLAAFQALLSRLSGQSRVVVGTDIANRNHRSIEGLIGFFVNQLVMPADVSADPTFSALLRQVRATALGAYAHQDVPFERLVEELTEERDLSRPPLFQCKLLLHEAGEAGGAAATAGEAVDEAGGDGELAMEPLGTHNRSSKFELTMILARSGDRLGGSLEYNSDLFEATTADRVAEAFSRLLAAVAEDPERPISALPLLSNAERHALLVEANETAMPVPFQPLHRRFSEWAGRRPEAVAVSAGGASLTYGELEHRSNQLAVHLHDMGVGPEVHVGLCLRRGPDLLVGILAILKAGGAYVPLDPEYPLERLRFVMEDSAVAILLSEEALEDELPTHWGHTVRIDADWEMVEATGGDGASPPAVQVDPADLAYVIYTSGSTGQPKGAQLTHGGLSNLAEVQRATFGVGPGEPVLQFASISFDASVFEITMALAAGGEVVIATADGPLAGADLTGLVEERGVTTVTLPPSSLAHAPHRELPALRNVIVAGEACPRDLVDVWAVGEGRRFFNAYGPTEATVWSTVAELRPGRRPNIGQPLGNLRAYVVDGHLAPVPTGVPGELLIGGPSLARGYLGRPALSAASFVPDPFSGRSGQRLYRTGDRVRWLADGHIDFLGRIDDQVKLRGYRIELGEVEAVLLGLPGVREAAVLVDEKGGRLIGYAAGDGVPEPAELRQGAGRSLPEYMVPAEIVVLDEMPKTVSGKVDRKALPKPGGAPAERVMVPLESPVEEAIAAAWAAVLEVDEVSRSDNFFDLGGHSLLLVQVHSRLHEALGVEISVVELFQHPTVESLAAYLEGLGAGPADAGDGEAAVAAEASETSTDASADPFADAAEERARRQRQARQRRRGRRPSGGGSGGGEGEGGS